MARFYTAGAENQFTEADWLGWPLAVSSLLGTSLVTPLSRAVITDGMSPSFLLLMRLSIASALLIATFALLSPRQLAVDRKGFSILCGVGILGGIEICCFFWALAWLDASMAALLKTTQPLVVLLLLRLRGELLTVRHLVRLSLAVGGVYLLIGPGGDVSLIGMLLIAGSLIFYAAQIVFTQWYLHSYNSNTVTVYMLSIMTVVVFVWWWGQGVAWRDPGTEGWLVIGVMAIVSTYLARLALYAAVPKIGSGQITLLWPLQMFVSVIIAVLFLQERLTPIQWIGGALILLSALLAIQRTRLVLKRKVVA